MNGGQTNSTEFKLGQGEAGKGDSLTDLLRRHGSRIRVLVPGTVNPVCESGISSCKQHTVSQRFSPKPSPTAAQMAFNWV